VLFHPVAENNLYRYRNDVVTEKLSQKLSLKITTLFAELRNALNFNGSNWGVRVRRRTTHLDCLTVV